MNRNNYDADVITFSPQGRLYQIEYAMKAVTQGSAAVAVKSKTHTVLATLKRSASELGSHRQKIFKIDDHIGIAIAGLTPDARVLCKFMRTECLQHRFVYGTPMPSQRLVTLVADKMQVHTQRYGRRPYGVGLLVSAIDQSGARVYELSPNGNYYDYKAVSIGARSQSAKTYLEKTYTEYEDCSLDQLIHHAIFALRETTGTQSEGLSEANVSISVVGVDRQFEIIENEGVGPYLKELDNENEDAMQE